MTFGLAMSMSLVMALGKMLTMVAVILVLAFGQMLAVGIIATAVAVTAASGAAAGVLAYAVL